LQQLLLIEHTPEPEAVEDGDSSVGLDDLDDEQRKEAEQYIRQLKVLIFGFSSGVLLTLYAE
jgi:hypothetical protein